MKKNLIVFGEDWMRYPTTSQHITKPLLNKMNVIWVNSLGLRRPCINHYDIKRIFKKIAEIFSFKKKSKSFNDITVITPYAIPLPNSKLVLWINGLIVSYQIRRHLEKDWQDNTVILAAIVTALPIIKRLAAKKNLYLCCDDFSTLAGIDHEPINQLELQLVKEVDHVIVISQALYQKFSWLKPTIVSQGVDLQLFTTQWDRPDDLPVGKPIIGFCGAIHEWVDLELLEKLVTQLPHYLFMFIGPIHTDVSRLKNHSNVIFTGAKPYQQVAAYLQHWDVSILPFRTERQEVKACDPLKLREYLAAGKPVVTTDFPAMHALSSVITIASSADKFIKAVEKYAKGEDDIGIVKRRIAVQNDGWEKKADQIAQLFD